MKLIVGSRGSKLALIQTNTVLDSVKAIHPETEFEVKVIKTLGDEDAKHALFTIDRRGIFEKELGIAIANNEIDLAVHSLKDVPTEESPDNIIAAIPKRGSPHDVLISKNRVPLEAFPKCGIVGTGSLRRLAEVKHLRPDLQIKAIRGNVDTRIRKVNDGEFDGVIVAEAGLERMGISQLIAERFSFDRFTPAAGQGALAVTAKKDNQKVIDLLKSIDDPYTRAEVTAERSLVLALEGGCRVPIGTIGEANEDGLSLYACMFSLDGVEKISTRIKGTLAEDERLGKQAAQDLLSQGAKEFEAAWREKYGPW
ncbi:MAG TPA: hydroxymethylbilane synthase [Candidatus Sulfotelmatobacter sp.]|nr:hydroxymethylbilane synthase [Candidatus Sulfotelmatobacter sp.]